MDPEEQEELRRQLAEARAKTAELEAKLAAPVHSGSHVQGDHNVTGGADSVVIGGDVFVNVITAKDGSLIHPKKLLAAYLDRVINETQFLRLDVIDQQSATESADARLRLAQVYTSLETLQPKRQQREELDAEASFRNPGEREDERLSAAAFASLHPQAALLGAPGSGKSTFVDMLALCLAGEMRQRTDVNLALLGEDWTAGALLPVRVTLRQFAVELVGAPTLSLWQHIEKSLGEGLPGFAALLRKHLIEHGGLALLDGLDEVPEAATCRQRVKDAVLSFQKDFPKVRLLLTSRTYAYQKQEWRLPGFAEAILAPFLQPQWEAFIDRWYGHLATLRPALTTDAATARAADLKAAIGRNAYVRELAERPLLLTLMASLHALRGGELPRRREQLYERSVDLLLDVWQKPRRVLGADGQPVLQQEGVADFLAVGRQKVEHVLQELAFAAHEKQPVEQQGCADIAEDALSGAMCRIANREINAVGLIDYVRDRAGIITHVGEKVYRFPHRSFQEYLAACHLCREGFPDKLVTLLRADPERWREIFLLAGASVSKSGDAPYAAWRLIECALSDLPRSGTVCYSLPLFCAELIQEAGLVATAKSEKTSRKCVVEGLVKLVESGQLPISDRARAGVLLGEMGDPRPGVGLTKHGLPDIAWLSIEAGPFLYGDKKQRRAIEQPYAISRYPITVAQYRAFVEAGGYREERFWDAGEFGRFQEPRDHGEPFQTANHPRVGVSWYESMAFCAWLSEAANLAITLPTEEQWERAARHTDGREYPWGKGEVPTRCNMGETSIGATSAVGLFPGGKAACGAEDMAGNAWEWCATFYNKSATNMAVARVLRGGSFDSNAGNVRCAIRNDLTPGLRHGILGFRVVRVLSPSASGL